MNPRFSVVFDWSRTLLSGGSSRVFLVMGILAMVGGPMGDRFGLRRVLLFTGTNFGIGFALISHVIQAWQMFLIGGKHALALCFMTGLAVLGPALSAILARRPCESRIITGLSTAVRGHDR